MSDSDTITLIRQVLREELTPILMAQVTSTESPERATIQRYSIETPIPNIRNIQPYGVASRPPAGMECLTVPVGGDPTHLNMLGQFDQNRPKVEEGEVCFYGPAGQHIWFANDGSTRTGIVGAQSPAVLGDILQVLMQNILKAILDAPQIGTCAVGPVVLDPSIRTKLAQELSTRVNANATNFLSQNNFIDRGSE